MIRPNHDLLAAPTQPDTADEKQAIIDLVNRANAGHSDAQAELVQRYTRRVAGFVRSIIRQPDAVEDVTQTVFIKMFRRLGRLREPAVFESSSPGSSPSPATRASTSSAVAIAGPRPSQSTSR